MLGQSIGLIGITQETLLQQQYQNMMNQAQQQFGGLQLAQMMQLQGQGMSVQQANPDDRLLVLLTEE